MKLELPDNNASVLFHMGNALQSIAKDLDVERVGKLTSHVHTGVSGMTPDELSDTVDKMIESVAADWKVPVNRLTGNTTDAEQYGKSVLGDCLDSIDGLAESIGIIRQQASDATVEASDTIDADGLPWDQRIHSRGKTRLADNRWRMARKPSDKSDEEWAEYVEGVKTELCALMAIEPPVREEVENVNLADDAVITPPVVIEAPEVVTPPVVIEAPEVVTPPVVDVVVTPPQVTTGPTTFPELMKFITVNNKKLTKESVDEALKAQGLASIALLAARTDLIPQVHAALVKLL